MTGNTGELHELRLLGITKSENKLPLVKLVKEISGLNLMEAKRLVESAPTTIVTCATREEAERTADTIEEVGGITEVSSPVHPTSNEIDDEGVTEMETTFSGEIDGVLDRFDSVLTEFWEQTSAPEEFGIPKLPTVHKFNRKSSFRQKRSAENSQKARMNPLYEHLLAKKEIEDKLGKSLRPLPPELELPSTPELQPVKKQASLRPAPQERKSTQEITDLSDNMLKLAPESKEAVYWVRRGKAAPQGPFKEINLRNNIANQRVRPDDLFSTSSAEGPWQKISSRFATPGQLK